MRPNIYGFPHKGLRNALGQLSFRIGSLDLSDEQEIRGLKELAEEVSELLSLHLHSEERYVLPPLEEKVPGSTEHNHEDHEEMERLEKEMMASVKLLVTQPTPALLDEAYRRTNYFIREYFRHMDEEEIDLNRIIWEQFEDQDIMSWQGQILSEFTPEVFFKWFKYIIPALQPIEQSIMLGGFKANAPEEAYRQTIEGLRPHLTEK